MVASYCATFLAAEMRHIYRQITGLHACTPVVLTNKRLHAEEFPFPPEQLVLLARPPALVREVRRFWNRHVSPGPVLITRREVSGLEQVLREREARLLHVYFGNSAMQLLPLLESRTLPCSALVSFHGADAGVSLDSPRSRRLVQRVFDSSRLVLARSNALLQNLGELGCPPEKLRLLRTGLPLQDWPLIGRTPPADGAWHFVQACRLIGKKGLETSLQALAIIRSRWPKATLEILGEGPLRSPLGDLAAQLGLSHAVRFGGFIDQTGLREAFAHAHFVLHPSRTTPDGDREGVPNALLEAMATGLPALATRHGGIPEAMTDGQEGRLVAENDAESLAAAALEIMAAPDQWSAMGLAAAESVRTGFGQIEQIASLESLYREAIGD